MKYILHKDGVITCEYQDKNCGSCRVKEHTLHQLLAKDTLVNDDGDSLCMGCGELPQRLLEDYEIDKNGIHDDCIDKQVARMVTRFGGIDGAHHKQWLIDQMLQMVLGKEEYQKWLTQMNSDKEYDSWDQGTPP